MTTISRASEAMSELTTSGLPPTVGCRFTVEVAEEAFTVLVEEDRISTGPVDPAAAPHFTYSLDAEAWDRFCAEPPPRGYTSAQSVVATLDGAPIGGDLVTWAAHAAVVDRTLEALRTEVRGPRAERNQDPAPQLDALSPISGGYLTVQVSDVSRRLYFESAGTGQPVLCLHTAGADSRQFRYLMEDAELTSRFRFVAFDLPWHGRSDPPEDWATTRYALDTTTYADLVLAFSHALKLEQPVLMGCSMGGAIALYLASRHGDEFRGVLALEGGLGNPGRFVPWTNYAGVDHSQFLTSWVGGLIAPAAPSRPRELTLWGYAQSGPGVYQGDTAFYSRDFPKHSAGLEPATCPLWVFSGEYDYSATTDMSREAAMRLGGELVEMRGSGHFPMSEDPETFRSFVAPVLDSLLEGSRS